MRFRTLTLRNFACYADASVSVDEGVTVIHGVNGSGKSSLLDACFFVLYGASTLQDRTLGDVITNGETEAEIELTFTHAGEDYTLYRRLRRTDERTATAECTLTTPAETIDGARPVRDEVTQLLRMDADAFLNCAYVRQGEVNKLIHASPTERQDMLDELLQLGVLEEYRDRAAEARRGIATIADELRGQLDQVTEQIEAKEDRELTATLNELATTRTELDDRLASLDERLDEVRSRREAAADAIEQAESRQAELEEVTEALESVRAAIEETDTERRELRGEIVEADERRQALVAACETSHEELGVTPQTRAAVEAALEAVDERDESLRDRIEEVRLELQDQSNAAEQATTDADDLGDRADDAATAADDAEEELAAERDAREERSEERSTLAEEREELDERFEAAGIEPENVDDTLEEYREELTSLREQASDFRARIESIAEDIVEAEDLVEAGHCPTCGQPVEGAPVVDHIAEDHDRREELQTELQSVESEVETVEDQIERYDALADAARRLERIDDRLATLDDRIADHDDRIEELEATVEEHRAEAERLREAAAERREDAATHQETVEQCRSDVAELNQTRADLRARRDGLEELLARYDRIDEVDEEISSYRDRRDQLAELNDERQERLADLRDRRNELADAVDEERLERAQEVYETATETIEELSAEQERLQERRDELIDRIGRVQNELEELRSLEERRDELVDEHDAIDTVHEEAAELEAMYGELRRDLRERNVAALEDLLNETFALVYRNDAYSRIELDRDYRFTIAQKDGQELDPTQLSGGERALFNLSLRCAIYRLLAEGIDGGAPLPPLIFDEPTVFLDRGHVGQLVELIDAMRTIGVEQIVVVTHDRELLNAADAALRVEKEPRTNRSSVVESAEEAAAVAQD